MLGVCDQTVGNVGRFFNHSAKPNLFMQCVHTGTCPGVDEPQHGKYDDRMPKLAFFAMKDIPAMTEVRPSCALGSYVRSAAHGFVRLRGRS